MYMQDTVENLPPRTCLPRVKKTISGLKIMYSYVFRIYSAEDMGKSASHLFMKKINDHSKYKCAF